MANDARSRARAAAQAAARTAARRRMLMRRVLPAGLGLLLTSGAIYWWIITAPYRVMQRFVRAAEERDTRTMYALSDPYEREHIHLTEAGLKAAFDAIFERAVTRDDIVAAAVPRERETADGTRYIDYFWTVYWRDKQTGLPIPGTKNPIRAQNSSIVVVKSSPSGWRVMAGQFLFTTSDCRWGYRGPFMRIAREAGMTHLMFEDGKILGFSELHPRTMVPPDQR